MNDLQELQRLSKYARWNYSKGRRETWSETVFDRLLPEYEFLGNGRLDKSTLQQLGQAIYRHEALGSMRLLAMAGKSFERDNIMGYNCAALVIDGFDAFHDLCILGMSGCGVTYSVESRHIQKLPAVASVTGLSRYHEVEDTTEGWARAVDFVIRMAYAGIEPIVDYQKVRPAGVVLKTKGGRASGPEPLKKSLEKIKAIIRGAAGRKLNSLELSDIMCWIGDASVSGGVRRTALMALFDYGDDLMREAKTGNWFALHPERRNVNLSEVWQGIDKESVYTALDVMLSDRGEPGFFNRQAAWERMSEYRRGFFDSQDDVLCNPCLTGDTLVLTDDGAKPIQELVGVEFMAVVNERAYYSPGFFSTGIKPVLQITTTKGLSLKITANHLVMTENGWIAAGELKTGDRLLLNAKNATTLSYYATVETITPLEPVEVFDCQVEGIHAFSANGIVVHNCGEAILNPNGVCNLSTAIIRPNDEPFDILHKVNASAILGTLQANGTYFPGLKNPNWERNANEQRLIGVSLSGLMDNHTALQSEVLRAAQETVKQANHAYSKLLGIPVAAGLTAIKPAGNTSVLVGAAPGLHARHYPYNKRRITLNVHDPILKVLEASGFPVEESGWNPGLEKFAIFPEEAPDGAITQVDFSALAQLEFYRQVLRDYVDQSVSVTITYLEGEQDGIKEWVWQHLSEVVSLTFIKAGAVYPQMPIEQIDRETYLTMTSNQPRVRWELLQEFEQDDYTEVAQEVGCAGGVCSL